MKTPHTEEDPMDRANNIDAGVRAFFRFIIKRKKGVWIMNDNTGKKIMESTGEIADIPENFEERLGKLSPFQRPILPPSYYPFACKNKPKKKQRQRRRTEPNLPCEKIHNLPPVICHLDGMGTDAGRLNQW